MLLFNYGRDVEYFKGPEIKQMTKFLEKEISKISTEIASAKTWEKVNKRKLALGYFGGDNEDFVLIKRLKRDIKNLKIYHSFKQEYHDLNGKKKLTLFRNFDGGKTHFDVDSYGFDYEKILTWIRQNR